MMGELRQRIISKVKIDDRGCWNWTASKKDGYGQMWVKGKKWASHRFSYFLHHGEIPENLLVCHRCDNPACVNPDHLFAGTNSDNMRDKVTKGRSPTKLSKEDVIAIRAAKGATQLQLAEKYGVSGPTICRIRTRQDWTWV
jgi:DNA-binding XRE family transcriptional regulator